MRSALVMKFVLFSVILNGAAVTGAQATNLANEISRISNTCEELGPQLCRALEEHAGNALFTFGKSFDLPQMIADFYFDNASSGKSGSVTRIVGSGAGISVNSSSGDGLMAVVDSKQFKIDSSVQDKSLVGAADINQPNAVPLSAAAWLFSSALFGFIVVANRRKI